MFVNNRRQVLYEYSESSIVETATALCITFRKKGGIFEEGGRCVVVETTCIMAAMSRSTRSWCGLHNVSCGRPMI